MLPTGSTQPLTRATVSSGHVAAQQARLDIPHLEESVSFYLEKALAPSTLRTYSSGLHRYMVFCTAANLQPIPLAEHTLCMFAAQLAKEGLTHQTIQSYLSAIRHFHIYSGQGDPFVAAPFPLLQYVLRGIKRSPSHAARQPRLPITHAYPETTLG